MLDVPEQTDIMPVVQYFGPAGVIEKDESGGRFRVTIPHPESGSGYITPWVRLAIPLPLDFHCGDRVLVAGNNDEFYIIGVLDHTPAGQTSVNRLELTCGVKAEKSATPESETLRVISKEGVLLFEYDASTGKSRVNAPSGGLEFHADNGEIALCSSKSIRLATLDSESGCQSSFTLEAGKMDFTSAELGITSGKGDFRIGETHFAGNALKGEVRTVRLAMKRFESTAETVVQKAKNIYQTVEELVQVHAGRMRALIEATLHVKSKRTFLKSEEDVKINGNKIYLG